MHSDTSETKSLKAINFGALIALVASAASILCLLLWLCARVANEMTPFDTDEADHANAALELFTAISRIDLPQILEAILRQSFYPPVHSFLVTLSYFVHGVSFSSSRIPSVYCFASYILLLAVAVFQICKGINTQNKFALTCIACAFTAAISSSSPITIYNSVLCMLELPAMLTIVLILFYLNFKMSVTFSKKSILCLALFSLVVFFTKYNFGIMIFPALFCTIMLSKSELFQARLKSSILYTVYVVLGLIIWTLLVDRASFFHFFVGHNSYDPLLSSENILFEIRAWFNSYCISSTIAGFILVCATIAAIKFWQIVSIRFSALLVLWSLFILVLSTTNEERHFMVALPALVYLSGCGFFILLAYLSSLSKVNNLWLLIPCLFLVLFIPPLNNHLLELDRQISKQFEGEATSERLFSEIVRLTDARTPIIINGVSDDFGIEALRWYFSATENIYYSELAIDAFPFRDDKNFTARKRKRNLDRPYLDKNFPKKPFSRVIAQSYYKYAVQIKNLFKEQRFKKEAEDFKTSLVNYPQTVKRIGSREVTIYSLEARAN